MYRLLTLVLLVLTIPSSGQSWKSHYDSSLVHWAKDWTKTISFLKQAEYAAALDLGIYDNNYLTIINDLGIAYWRSHDLANAEKTFTRRLLLAQERNQQGLDQNDRIARMNLAGLYADKGDYYKARQLYRHIVTAESGDASPLVVQASIGLVSLYQKENKDSAVVVWRNLEVQHAILNCSDPDLSNAWRLQGVKALREQHKYDQAESLLKPLLKLPAEPTKPRIQIIYIESIEQQALIDLENGHLGKAENGLLEAYRILVKSLPQEYNLHAAILNDLGRVYEKLNVPDKALSYYKQSLDLCERIYMRNGLPCLSLQNNIGGIYLRTGKIREAKVVFSRILEVYQEVAPGDVHLRVTVMNSLATALQKSGSLDEGIALLNNALTLLNSAHAEADLGIALHNNLAVMLAMKGDLKTSAAYFETALSGKRLLYGNASLTLKELMSNLALVYWNLGESEKALDLFNQSLDLSEREIRYIFPGLNEVEQGQYYSRLNDEFERYNSLVLVLYNRYPEVVTRMLENRMLIKSLKFLTQKRKRDLLFQSGDTVALRNLELLKAKREELGHYYQLPLDAVSLDRITTLEAEIERMNKALNDKGDAFMQDGRTEWTKVRDALLGGEALVEIVRFRKFHSDAMDQDDFTGGGSFGFTDSIYYAAVIITPHSRKPELVVLREGKNMETRFLNYYRNCIRFNLEDENSYASYWKPFAHLLTSYRKIYFSNDGVYHNLSLSTLFDNTSRKHLIEENDVHLLLNPQQIIGPRALRNEARQAVLFGDPHFEGAYTSQPKTRKGERPFQPLPGTHQEIVEIEKILRFKQWQAQVYLKQSASERNLKQIASPAILHIATHGFFSNGIVTLNDKARNDFLFHSGLVLSGGERRLHIETEAFSNDGIVTAYEVMNLNLSSTELVVLSACETGLGKIENGEGVYGLQRSFLQAGARSVLISLWKVDDHYTKDLMISFYGKVSSGMNHRQALKMAQLELMRKTHDPMHWGAFVMVGTD